jgi:SAM-dependent methyltransferase
VKLNLGCGNDKRKGYVNCDISNATKPDKVFNLEKKFPFKNNSATEIIALNVIEHLDDPMKFMEECWRVLKNNGKLILGAPHTSNTVYAGAMTHKSTGINAYSFEPFKPGNPYNYYTKAKFKVDSIKYHWFNFFGRRLIEYFCNKHIFLAEHILAGVIMLETVEVKLTAVKH